MIALDTNLLARLLLHDDRAQHARVKAQCHAALVALRLPEGFVCSDCGCAQHCTFVREERRYWQCSACRTEFTVTCGTVFEATKLPLRRWFLAGT